MAIETSSRTYFWFNRNSHRIVKLEEGYDRNESEIDPLDELRYLLCGTDRAYPFHAFLIASAGEAREIVSLHARPPLDGPFLHEAIRRIPASNLRDLHDEARRDRDGVTRRSLPLEWPAGRASSTLSDFIVAPVAIGPNTFGILLFGAAGEGADPDSAAWEKTLARMIADSVQRLLRFHRREVLLRARTAVSRRLEEINRAISHTLDLTEVLRMVRDGVVEAGGFDRAGVFIVDDRLGIIKGVWGTDPSGRLERIDKEVFFLDNPDEFGRIVRREVEYFLTQDYVSNQPLPEFASDPRVGAHACLPFIADGEVVGLLALDNLLTRRSISEEDLRRIRPFCDEAAVAIRNARLHDTLRARVDSLRLLQDIGNEVRATTDPDSVLRTLSGRVRQLFDVSEASVFLFNESFDALVWQSGVRLRDGAPAEMDPIVPPVMRSTDHPFVFRCIEKQAPVVAQTPRDPMLSESEAEWMRAEGIMMMACAPLNMGERRFGILSLRHVGEERRLSDHDLEILQSLANQSSVALLKAQLLAETEEALFRANQVNLNLRQAFMPNLPASAPGLDIGHLFEPVSREIRLGGDFYDLYRLGPKRYGFVIGDVAGHDLDAAIQTAAAKYLLRAFIEKSANTGLVLKRLNEALLNQFASPAFVSLFLGILDLSKGKLTYTNAGHEPPLLLLPDPENPGRVELQSVSDADPLLAIRPRMEYRQRAIDFPVDAALVLFTDGITEARRGDGFLMPEGVASVVLDSPRDTVQSLVNGIWERVRSYADRLPDDVAILAMKRTS